MAEKPLEPLENPISFAAVPPAGQAGDAAHVLSLVAEDAARLTQKDNYGCDALTWGARNSFAPVVSAALGKDSDVESKSFGGLRPLHHACQAYSEDIIKELLDKKADPTSKDDAGNTPFHFACRRGVLALCQLLLAAKADVAMKNNAGHAPLHVACNSGQISIVQWLLSKDADPNDADKQGDTPLHVAARAGFKGIVSALLAGGAKQASNRSGKTPAQVALDKEIAALLAS